MHCKNKIINVQMINFDACNMFQQGKQGPVNRGMFIAVLHNLSFLITLNKHLWTEDTNY